MTAPRRQCEAMTGATTALRRCGEHAEFEDRGDRRRHYCGHHYLYPPLYHYGEHVAAEPQPFRDLTERERRRNAVRQRILDFEATHRRHATPAEIKRIRKIVGDAASAAGRLVGPPRDRVIPGKRQTRRSVSLRGLTHQRLEDYCRTNGLAVAGFAEDVIAAELNRLGVPEQTTLRKVYRSRQNDGEPISGVVTL